MSGWTTSQLHTEATAMTSRVGTFISINRRDLRLLDLKMKN